MGLNDVDYDEYIPDDDEDLDLSDLDPDEVFFHPSEILTDTSIANKVVTGVSKEYLQFLKTYFSSFFARKMVSSFTQVVGDNQILCTNTSGSLLDESSSGYLATALYTFKKHQEYITQLYQDLLLDTTRSMYLYKPSAYLSLLNKYKDTLIVKRYSNTTIVGVGDESEQLTSKNNLATLVTSQFIAKNIQILYDTVNDLQNHKTEEFKILDVDITKLKKLPPYIWYDLNIHEISDCFEGCKPNMVLVWLDGMDLPSVSEFLKKTKNTYRLQLITRVYNDRYIRYGVEYEDDNVICTFTRPNVVLYPNTKI